MIQKLSLNELIEAAVTLDKLSQALLIAAIAGSPAGPPDAGTDQLTATLSAQWAAIAHEGLARAYGDAEPTYSDADLLP